jgi:hypothetical protein
LGEILGSERTSGAPDHPNDHRVDRLSRSLLDFAKLMETFEQHGVAFVSVTKMATCVEPTGFTLRASTLHCEESMSVRVHSLMIARKAVVF